MKIRILVPSLEQERARAILSQTYEDGELDWEKGMPEPSLEGEGE